MTDEEWAKAERSKAIAWASDGAAEMLRHAVRNVDDRLGAGAAMRFPEIVAALVQASALALIDIPDLRGIKIDTDDIAAAIGAVGNEIRDASFSVGSIASAISDGGK